MPRLESCTEGAQQVRTLHRGGQVDDPQEYFRYWAGYTVLSRPVLALGGMDACGWSPAACSAWPC